MRPTNPKTYTLTTDNRLTIGEQFLPAWLDKDDGAPALYCVPLIWAREIELPQGHDLEAWYVWNGQESTTNWRISPRALLDGQRETVGVTHQAAIIYDASIEATDRKYRMACTGLFSTLRDLGHRRMWVTLEAPSLAIWTDFAYQAWHGKLTAET